ncbi:anti-sigma factor [Pseudoponticoccus marisrubri]|uniref:Regulator of SigK n=1 Tax=Pseudoponticoccus marisrubri TaxID=1685382 RepID=A0A0W7WNT2_9RHOB|nr:anti-sigma factor [Pseudoponticoccus marisrubri]KUF12254.1 hypothetical protein AVJ23_00520 [Pseudoponticoccus marisrubri]
MSDQDDTDLDEGLPGGWQAAAAEYALGLLEGAERQDFEARLAQDPDLRQDVAAWTEYFTTFTDQIAEETPPPALLRRIEAEAFGPPPTPLWRQVLPYLAGAVAGAAMAWAVFVSGVLETGVAEIRAELEPAQGDLVFAVRIDPPTHTMAVDYVSGTIPEDRVLELWLIPQDANPISLGVMSEAGNLVVVLPDLLAERVPGATLAVSDEPPGGSPTGQPTGRVQAAGEPVPL